MSLIQHYIFRALCSIAVGALLVKYRQDMVEWMTIIVGILFFLSGLVSVITAYARHAAAKRLIKAQAAQETGDTTQQAPATAPGYGLATFVGLGCMLLGLVLAVMPMTFINSLVYVLAAFLILGAVQQFFSLAMAHREWHVGFGYWVMPGLLLIAGIVAVAKPDLISSAPIFFIGWCMIIYGVVEFVNGIKSYRCHKKAVAQTTPTGKPDFSQAEEVEYIEVNEPTTEE